MEYRSVIESIEVFINDNIVYLFVQLAYIAI